MLADFLRNLSPLIATKRPDLDLLIKNYEKRAHHDVYWYPGCGFDFSPLQDKVDGRIRNAMPDGAPVFYSDFHPNCYSSLVGAQELFSSGSTRLSQLKAALTYLHGPDGEVKKMIPFNFFPPEGYLSRLMPADSSRKETRYQLIERSFNVMYLAVNIGGISFDIFYLLFPAKTVLYQVFLSYGIGLMTIAPLGSWKGGEYLGDLALIACEILPLQQKPEFVLTNQTFDFNRAFMKRFKYCSLILDRFGKTQLYRRRHKTEKRNSIAFTST